MILEFFGPPGGGKTTLAKAVTAQLRKDGYDVLLISSYRPAETALALSNSPMRSASQRLSRAVVETTRLVCDGSLRGAESSVTNALFRAMPTRHIVWKLRMYQYLARLCCNWATASSATRITLFDQGFVQAVYSLAVLSGRTDRSALDTALGLVPMPDLLIRLNAPRDLVAARLEARRQRHGRLERLLEVSPATNLASLPILSTIDEILQVRGIPTVRAEAGGDWPVDSIVSTIRNAIQARHPVSTEAAA